MMTTLGRLPFGTSRGQALGAVLDPLPPPKTDPVIVACLTSPAVEVHPVPRVDGVPAATGEGLHGHGTRRDGAAALPDDRARTRTGPAATS